MAQMKLNELRQKLMEAEMNSPNPQQQKPPNDSELRQKIFLAKSRLGLKDVNPNSAVIAHNKIRKLVAQNPKAPFNQILTRLPPNQRKAYMDIVSRVPSDSIENTPMQKYRRQLTILKNSFEISDDDFIGEEITSDPPVMIVLKRKGIRIFPDGKRVALYVNDKLGLTFTVPYTTNKGAENPMVGVTEEIDFVNENIEHIKDIVSKKQAKKLKFADGSSMNVDHTTASAIHNVHNALNDQNKAKFAKMLGHSSDHFNKAAYFALKQHKFVINK